MIRDPFYQDIIQGLNGRLDPELFEQCAVNSLCQVHSLVSRIAGQ